MYFKPCEFYNSCKQEKCFNCVRNTRNQQLIDGFELKTEPKKIISLQEWKNQKGVK